MRSLCHLGVLLAATSCSDVRSVPLGEVAQAGSRGQAPDAGVLASSPPSAANGGAVASPTMAPVQMTPNHATDPKGAMAASTGVPTSASDAGARADLEDDASVDDDDDDEIDEEDDREDDERGTQSATDAGERD